LRWTGRDARPPRCIIAVIVQRQSFDAEYLKRLTDGDGDTERDFYAYFGELLSIKLRSRLRSPQLIDDAKQETFLRVLRTLREKRNIQTPQALGSFVNSVCNNVLFELYRSESRASEELTDRADGEKNAEIEIMEEEDRVRVRRVLAELPEKDRKILRWLFFEERDKSAICAQLKVDREYLRVLVHRAKSRFRDDYLKVAATNARRAAPSK
jgi:RNA polymerase sigma-70 factor, ECF subfamily